MTPLAHAEQAVLGAIFLDPDQLGRLSGWLRPEHFDRPVHAALYQAMLNLQAQEHPAAADIGKSPVPVSWITDTVQEASRHMRGLTSVYPHLLVSACPRPQHAPVYGRMVLEGAIHRRVIQHTKRLHQVALADLDTGTADETLHHAQLLSNVLAKMARTWGTEARPLMPPDVHAPATEPPPRAPEQVVADEEFLLGCLASHPEQLLDLVLWLHPADFADRGHQHIYRALSALHHRGEPIDQLTVLWEVQHRGALSDGTLDPDRVLRVCDPLAPGGPAEHYGTQVVTSSLARTAAIAARQVRELAEEDALAPGQLINYALYALSPLDDVRHRHRIAHGLEPSPTPPSPQHTSPTRTEAARARSQPRRSNSLRPASPPASPPHSPRPTRRSPS